jgi:hypothetical protein
MGFLIKERKRGHLMFNKGILQTQQKNQPAYKPRTENKTKTKTNLAVFAINSTATSVIDPQSTLNGCQHYKWPHKHPTDTLLQYLLF